MGICLCCGKESEKVLCESCVAKTDLEQLCKDIINYSPATGTNEIWNNEATKLEYVSHFKEFAFEVASFMESPLREYWQMESFAGNTASVPKAKREWLYETAPVCLKSVALSSERRNRVHGLVLDAAYKDYKWQIAEDMAADLSSYDSKNKYVLYSLGVFYTYTRRYDVAEEILREGLTLFVDDAYKDNFEKALEDVRKRVEGEKKEYIPTGANGTPKEEKQRLADEYLAFMASKGIEIELVKVSQKKKAISKDQYPEIKEVRSIPNDTFVAFDVETTGRNATTTSATEIGAIRVVNGEIVESKEFTFQELVHPIDSRIPEDVEKLTGITNEMVKDARNIEDVFNDFADFIGDDILLGYNCMAFDSKVITRSGRYAHRIIENPYFDVLYPARNYKKEKGLENAKLGTVSESLGITNPEAHRALADAITTAKVYMALKKEGFINGDEASVDDFLNDEEAW